MSNKSGRAGRSSYTDPLIVEFPFFSGTVAVGGGGGLYTIIWEWDTPEGHTEKKEHQIFLLYKEIQNGAYMTNGLLIYGEIFAHFFIYWKALPHIWLCNYSTLNFFMYEENFIFFSISALWTILLTPVCYCYVMYPLDGAYLIFNIFSSLYLPGIKKPFWECHLTRGGDYGEE